MSPHFLQVLNLAPVPWPGLFIDSRPAFGMYRSSVSILQGSHGYGIAKLSPGQCSHSGWGFSMWRAARQAASLTFRAPAVESSALAHTYRRARSEGISDR